MRPFFPTVQDFAAATVPHFRFLVADFGFVGPSIEEQTDEMYDVAYYGPLTAVLLNWDTTGSFFACNLAPRFLDGTSIADYRALAFGQRDCRGSRCYRTLGRPGRAGRRGSARLWRGDGARSGTTCAISAPTCCVATGRCRSDAQRWMDDQPDE